MKAAPRSSPFLANHASAASTDKPGCWHIHLQRTTGAGDVSDRPRSRDRDDDQEHVVEYLRALGKHDQASQAATELPDKMDDKQHAGLLDKFGAKADALMSHLGRVGDKLEEII